MVKTVYKDWLITEANVTGGRFYADKEGEVQVVACSLEDVKKLIDKKESRFENGVKRATQEIENRLKCANTLFKDITVLGTDVTVAVDQSRFGTIYRLWNIPGVPKHALKSDQGWNDIKRLEQEADKLIRQYQYMGG